MRNRGLIMLMLAAVYGIAGGTGKAASDPATAFLTGQAQNFVLNPAPAPLPMVQFQDAAGAAHTFGEFQGKIVLVNLWATWCVPCRTEMPSLDRLQQQMGGADFQIVLISLDRAGHAKAAQFLAEIGVHNLTTYVDPSAKAARALGAFGLPATLLLNRKGDEIGRINGAAEWDSPEVKALIAHFLAKK